MDWSSFENWNNHGERMITRNVGDAVDGWKHEMTAEQRSSILDICRQHGGENFALLVESAMQEPERRSFLAALGVSVFGYDADGSVNLYIREVRHAAC